MQRLMAILLVIILMPIWLALIVIQLFVFGNIWFTQTRIGKNGHPFTIVKFQSLKAKMNDQQADKERLNHWGRFLRASCLDETPQLINIIQGKMAFVGPRPLLPEYLELYTPTQRRRHEVKPGITGWAQVNGRNALSWNDQFKQDVWYVDHRDFWLDVRILFLTIKKLFSRSSGENHLREAFNGKN